MNKKLIIPIAVVIILLAVGVFWYFYKDTYNYNTAVKNSDPSGCLKIKDEFVIVKCLGEIALSTEDVSVCVNSPRLYIMTCMGIFADKNSDITRCQYIASDVDKYNCYYAFANSKKDISACDALTGDDKDYCIKSAAIAKNDASICDSLPDSSIYKENCAGDVAQQNPNY